MKALPPDVYRALAALKAEGTTTYSAMADILDIPEFDAAKILSAFAWLAWAEEQILFDHSSEFAISPCGVEVLKSCPRPLDANGYMIPEPPAFKPIPSRPIQTDLFR